MTTKRFATRDFQDAGTDRNFKAGDEITDVKPAQLADWEHAGLVADKAPEKAAEKPSTDKAGDKPA